MVMLPRYSIAQLPLCENLWQHCEELSGPVVDRLLESLAIAVSNGYLGLAAELSDQIRARAAALLDAEPRRRVCLEIEHMKRLAYMGYQRPTVEAADRALHELHRCRDRLCHSSADVWEFEAIGYQAWLERAPTQLKSSVERLEHVAAKHRNSSPFYAILWAFVLGTRGRLHALQGDRVGTVAAFEEGVTLLRQASHWRSLAHLQAQYAEHLALLGDWDGTVQVATAYLNEALALGLRSHLLLRIGCLLLAAPDASVSATLRRQLRFRCYVLMHAMGLWQSRTVVPLLAQASAAIAPHPTDVLFDIDIEAGLIQWLRSLDHLQMERVMAAYYSCLGYEATVLPEDEPALDILALRRDGEGLEHCVGVQVKHHLTRPIYKDSIPDEQAFHTLKDRLRERATHRLPTIFHWHCARGIHTLARDLLERRLRQCFGDSCCVHVTDLFAFVKALMSDPHHMRIVFSVESVGDGPSLGVRAHG